MNKLKQKVIRLDRKHGFTIKVYERINFEVIQYKGTTVSTLDGAIRIYKKYGEKIFAYFKRVYYE